MIRLQISLAFPPLRTTQYANTLYPAIVLLLSLAAWMPFTYSGFIQTHAGFLPIYNLTYLATQPFSVFWMPNVGRVPNLWQGEGVLPYDLARVLPLAPADAIKTLFALCFVLGGLGMFAWLNQLWGERSAVLGAVLYTFAPYWIAATYVRGALAECAVLAWLAWLLWALERSKQPGLTNGLGLVLIVALGWGLQAGLALFGCVLALAYLLLACKPIPRQGVVGLAVGIGLGALSLLPAVLPWQSASAVHFNEHFAYFFQLLATTWGQGPSVPGWQDTLPLGLGVVLLGLAMLTVFLRFEAIERAEGAEDVEERPESLNRFIKFWTGVALLTAFLSLSTSQPIWQFTGLSRFLTYPWQMLLLTTLAVSALGATLPRLDTHFDTIPAWAGLLLLPVVSLYPNLQPTYIPPPAKPSPVAVFSETRDQTQFPILLLVDAQVDGALQPGSTVTVQTQWQALSPIMKDYTVFVHIEDAAGQLQAQQDTQPQAGKAPTSGWLPGAVIADCYVVPIPASASGPLHVTLGWYELASGQRLHVYNDTQVTLKATNP